MSGAPCWFCEDASAEQLIEEVLHDPKTRAEETVSAGACPRCYKLVRSANWITIIVLIAILLAGVVIAWIVANRVVPDRGPSGARGKALGLIFWPIIGVFLLIDALVWVVLRRVLRTLFHLQHIDLVDHPQIKELRRQGYQWGKAPAEKG